MSGSPSCPSPTAAPPKLCSFSRAARLLGVGRTQIYRWLEQGRLTRSGFDHNKLALSDVIALRDQRSDAAARGERLPPPPAVDVDRMRAEIEKRDNEGELARWRRDMLETQQATLEEIRALRRARSG